MMTDEQEAEVKERMAEFADKMQAAMKHRIGQPLTQQSRLAIGGAIGSLLEREGSPPPQVEVRTLWSRMGWGDRCKWYASNRVFRWVGREVRAYRDAVQILLRDTVGHQVEAPRIPDWAVDSPKTMLVVDAKFHVASPLNSIELKLEVSKT